VVIDQERNVSALVDFDQEKSADLELQICQKKTKESRDDRRLGGKFGAKSTGCF